MIFFIGVIKIKTKLLIIVMAVVLFVNSYDLRVFAATEYDHNELMQYKGYGDAMYETIVEQTTYITGKHTENKEYVEESINTIKGYADYWKKEYSDLGDSCYQTSLMNCFGEISKAGASYMLTVGDWVKNLFNNANTSEQIAPLPDYSGLLITSVGATSLHVANTHTMKFSHHDPSKSFSGFSGLTFSYSNSNVALDVAGLRGPWVVGKRYTEQDIYMGLFNAFKESGNASMIYPLLSYFGITLTIVPKGVAPTPININFNRMNQHVQDNPVKMVTPQPKAYLSCPDGTRISMTINGSTFLDKNGQVMQVSKDGIAMVDSQICNLGWEKPKVDYVPGTDQVGITQPDGKIIDVETGETISGDFDDEIEDGCGTICAIGKLLKGLGTLASSITSIPLKILDGLFELIKKIVVPPENYLTEQMDTIKEEFFNEEIEEGIQSIEELSSVGGGTFESVQVSIMGVDNVMVVDSSSVNKSLDTIHSWIRGIFYPLLLFFNINMLYRLIRGTSLVGIGKIDFSPPKEGKK